MKKYIIPWSGGFDSTAIVLSHIVSGNEFDTIHISFDNNAQQHRIERARIRRLIHLIEKAFGYSVTHRNSDMYNLLEPHKDVLFNQPFMWANALVYNASSEYDAVSFGYLRKSAIWHAKNEFLKLIKNGRKLTMLERYKPLKVEFPFEWYTKADVFTYLKDTIPEAYRDVFFRTMWTCENPVNGKPCGKCMKCKEIQPELEKLDELIIAVL